MNAFVAYLAARDHTTEIAQEARPNSPIRPDRPRNARRLRFSTALHRLADRLAPPPSLPPRPSTSTTRD